MLRIACDLDGTIADMDGALQREAQRLFGPGVELRDAGQALERASAVEEAPPEGGEAVPKRGKGLTDRQMRQLWNHVNTIENFWMTLSEIEPGSVARFAALAAAHRWEVIFLTQRPPTAGETAQRQSQRWLQAHGFELPSVYVMNGSRGKVAAGLRLHALVDDRAENCLDVIAESQAKPILIWRGAPETVPPGAARLGLSPVFSFADALQRLEQMMATVAKSPSLLGRLRSAIGLPSD